MSEKSWQTKTKAICPKCEKYHIVEIFWTGKGIPKKFCAECKRKYVNEVDEDFLYSDEYTDL